MIEAINPNDVKKRSETIILKNGGEILEFLPTIEIQKPKTIGLIIDRALTLNALIQLYFGAPKYIISRHSQLLLAAFSKLV